MNYKADILVVEDNQINRMVALQILGKSGYQVESVADGYTALSTLAEHTFRLVLMDIQMPGLDGMETSRRIRAGKDSILDTDVPIIAMTAYTGEQDHSECMEAGMNAYIEKPLNLDKFLETVGAYIRPL